MPISLPPLRIVYATTWFGTPKFMPDQKLNEKDCPLPDDVEIDYTPGSTHWCTLTSNTDNMEDAAALMFHAPDTRLPSLPEHTPNQPWILESLEAPYSSPFRAATDSMKDFDYLASYNFKSTFLFSYFSTGIMDVANRPLPKDFIKTKTKKAPILWIAKNCRATSGREKYIEKLMEYVDVHSYGDCLNNMPFPEDKSRMDLLGEYKFYLAMENSNCEDYATEKLYDTLSMSAVPIVDGPASYDGYIPTKRSVIYADAYPDPKDLADYINYLHNNDTAYLEYLSYRRDALSVAAKDRLEPSFIANWNDTIAFNERSSYCSVCRGVLPWWEYKSDATITATYEDPNKGNIFLADQTCADTGKWNYIASGPPYHPSWTPRSPDEFTRPGLSVELEPVSTPTSTITTSGSTIDRENAVIAVNVLLVFLYILFISFLYRISKRHPVAHSQV